MKCDLLTAVVQSTKYYVTLLSLYIITIFNFTLPAINKVMFK